MGRALTLQLATLAALLAMARWRAPEQLVSIAQGGVLMAVNLWLGRRLGQLAARSAQPKRLLSWGLPMKFALLTALALTLLFYGRPAPGGFLVGMATLGVGIVGAILTAPVERRRLS